MVIDNWKLKLNKQTEERVSETEHTKEKKSLKEKNMVIKKWKKDLQGII